MKIAKRRLMDLLAERGDDQSLTRAGELLEDPVDTDAQGGLLAQLGICPLDFEAADPAGPDPYRRAGQATPDMAPGRR